MNPLIPRHLAEYLNVDRSSISLAIKGRNGNKPLLKTVTVSGKKMVDVDNPFNQLYIRDVCGRKGIDVPDFSAQPEKKESVIVQIKNKPAPQPRQNNDNDSDDDEIDYTAEKKKWDAKKAEAQTIKENIQIEKIRGNLIPVGETSHVVSYIVSNYTSSCRSHLISFLSSIVKELGGSDDQYRKYLDNFDEGLVEFAENAIEEISSGIEGVVDGYQEIRGRGEKR